MANTFNLGNGNWAQKTEKLLAYNAENDNYKPLPFDFDRGSTATRVNKDGLIETVGTDEPRIDFLNNTKGHLLLEPSRKNDITDYTGASFSAFNGASITANDSTSPDGSANATLMTTTGTTNELIQQASIAILSGQSYTVSGYFKLKSGTLSDPDNAFKGLDGLNGGGITGSTFNSTLTNEWQRLSFTVTSSTTSGRVQIKCEDTAEILVWGLQVEEGSYATSVIPTSGSTATRSAETCNNAGNEQVINSTEGVLYAEIAALGVDSSYRQITIGNSTDNIKILFNASSTRLRGLLKVGGINQADLFDETQTEIKYLKIALKYKSGDFALWVNGVEKDTETSGSIPTGMSEISFDDGGGSADFYGNIKDLKVYNTALSDSELQALTS
jgi:hypothetical protein